MALFVRGMGLGSVMMPTISAAYTELGRDAVTRAAPTLSDSPRNARPSGERWARKCSSANQLIRKPKA
ncbi:hypothetical protein C5F51_34525 [Nocardia nova]|uniref:Uncharacterized protein n=1 Tax=Nocardia nova TaxID=37330 RepID=A0A2S5ZVE1_9NOCA|nr:hypothetical protein C5F51_34525 [Nocardia nova]